MLTSTVTFRLYSPVCVWIKDLALSYFTWFQHVLFICLLLHLYLWISILHSLHLYSLSSGVFKHPQLQHAYVVNDSHFFHCIYVLKMLKTDRILDFSLIYSPLNVNSYSSSSTLCFILFLIFIPQINIYFYNKLVFSLL